MNIALMLIFISTSNTFNLPQGLMSAICFVESGHNVNAIHYHDGKGNSVGICQLKLSTARQLGFQGTEQQLMIPNINIYYATKYLAHQRDRYNGNLKKAIIAYNTGSAKSLIRTEYSDKVIKEWKQQEVAINE